MAPKPLTPPADSPPNECSSTFPDRPFNNGYFTSYNGTLESIPASASPGILLFQALFSAGKTYHKDRDIISPTATVTYKLDGESEETSYAKNRVGSDMTGMPKYKTIGEASIFDMFDDRTQLRTVIGDVVRTEQSADGRESYKLTEIWMIKLHRAPERKGIVGWWATGITLWLGNPEAFVKDQMR